MKDLQQILTAIPRNEWDGGSKRTIVPVKTVVIIKLGRRLRENCRPIEFLCYYFYFIFLPFL